MSEGPHHTILHHSQHTTGGLSLWRNPSVHQPTTTLSAACQVSPCTSIHRSHRRSVIPDNIIIFLIVAIVISHSKYSNMDPSSSSVSSKYPAAVQACLQRLDFSNSNIPKHILGFSPNFLLTKERIDLYLWDLHGNGNGNPALDEQQVWNSLSPLQQKSHEYNIEVLQQEQARLFSPAPLPPPPPTPSNSPNKRKASQNNLHCPAAQPQPTKKLFKSRAATAATAVDILESEEEEESEEDEDEEQHESNTGHVGGNKKIQWTHAEEQKLIEAVRCYQSNDKIEWSTIAKQVFHGKKSFLACFHHYTRVSFLCFERGVVCVCLVCFAVIWSILTYCFVC